MTGPASIAASLTASGDSLKRLLAAPSTPAAAIQSLHRCAGYTSYEGITGIYGIAGAAAHTAGGPAERGRGGDPADDSDQAAAALSINIYPRMRVGVATLKPYTGL